MVESLSTFLLHEPIPIMRGIPFNTFYDLTNKFYSFRKGKSEK